jgi:hypothetical protein
MSQCDIGQFSPKCIAGKDLMIENSNFTMRFRESCDKVRHWEAWGAGVHFRESGGLEYDAAMAVSEETLARAQRFDRSAAEAVLADSYAAVHRIARGLTGREAAAKQVVAGVLTRSLRVLPSWRKGVSPENWFYHHTVLTSRAAAANGDSPATRSRSGGLRIRDGSVSRLS